MKNKHRYEESFQAGVVNGTTHYAATWVFVPCPNCGEPRPMQRFMDSWYGKVVGWPAILFASLVVPYYMADSLFWHGKQLSLPGIIFYLVSALVIYVTLKKTAIG